MTALVVAIILVIAAIVFVAYDEYSSHSKLFENQKFATAVAEAMEKTPASLSEKTLSDVKYLNATYNAGSSELSVVVGNKNFDIEKYITLNDRYEELNTEYSNLSADTEADHTSELTAIETELYTVMEEINALGEDVSSSLIEIEGLTTLDDIKYFTSVELLELSGITLTDSSVFAGMKNLVSLSAGTCGLTEVNGLAGLDASKVIEINLSGNEITDWSPLNYIQDKVLVSSTYSIAQTEDGSYTLVPVEQTLTDYYAEQAAAEEEAEAEAEETVEETVEAEEATEEVADETAEEATEETVEAEEVTE